MSTLRARRVTRQPAPRYPTKLEVLAAPRLLEKHQPPAWLSNRELAAAAGVFLAVNAGGCADGTQRTRPDDALPDASLTAYAVVAPVFEHGKGNLGPRGVLGCIAVAAPVFLSEEEAAQVIAEELAQAGLVMSERNVALEPVNITGEVYRREHEWLSGEKKGRWVEISGPLAVDLSDPQHRVAVEFVSYNDFFPLGGDNTGEWAMDVKRVAGSLGAEVGRQGHGVYFVAFYDPYSYYRFAKVEFPKLPESPSRDEEMQAVREYFKRRRKAEEPAREAARQQSRELLRQQVKDFANWLKGQGVI